jgi:hypothetical protein
MAGFLIIRPAEPKEVSMNVNGSNNAASGMAMLKKANEQPKIALDLINKTMQGVEQAKEPQKAPSPESSAALAAATGKGQVINIKA